MKLIFLVRDGWEFNSPYAKVLVANNDFEHPIIGFNVIEELAQRDAPEDNIPSGHMVQRLCYAMQNRDSCFICPKETEV